MRLRRALSLRRPARSGVVMVFLVLALAVFFAFMALVVDVGYHYTKKAEIQIQADACALQALSTVVYAYERRYSTNAQTDIARSQEKAIMDTVVSKFNTANGYGGGYFTPIYTDDDEDDDVKSVTIDKVVPSSFFFAELLRIPSF